MTEVSLSTEKVGEGGVGTFSDSLSRYMNTITPRVRVSKRGGGLIIRHLEVLIRAALWMMKRNSGQAAKIFVNEELLAVFVVILFPSARVVPIIHGTRFWERENKIQSFLWNKFRKKFSKVILVPGLQGRIDTARLHENIHVLSDEPMRFRAVSCLKRQIKRFVYVGRLVELKSVDNAIHLVNQLNATGYICSLHIFGDGPDKVRLEKCASGDSNTTFYGSIDYNQVEELLKSFDCFVHLPTGLESYGLAPREALCVGLPIIINDNGGLKSLAGYSQVYVLPGNFCSMPVYNVSHELIKWLKSEGKHPPYMNEFRIEEMLS